MDGKEIKIQPVDWNEVFGNKRDFGGQEIQSRGERIDSRETVRDFVGEHLLEIEKIEFGLNHTRAKLEKAKSQQENRKAGAATGADLRLQGNIDSWQYEIDGDQLELGRVVKEKARILENILPGLGKKDSAHLYDKILTHAELSDETIEGLLVAWTRATYKKNLDKRGIMDNQITGIPAGEGSAVRQDLPEKIIDSNNQTDESVAPGIKDAIDGIGKDNELGDGSSRIDEVRLGAALAADNQSDSTLSSPVSGIEFDLSKQTSSTDKTGESMPEISTQPTASQEILPDQKPEGMAVVSPSGEIVEGTQEEPAAFQSSEKVEPTNQTPVLGSAELPSPEATTASQQETKEIPLGENSGQTRIDEIRRTISGPEAENNIVSTSEASSDVVEPKLVQEVVPPVPVVPSAEEPVSQPKKRGFFAKLLGLGGEKKETDTDLARDLHNNIQGQRAPHTEEGEKQT